jgi:hypothetical protein
MRRCTKLTIASVAIGAMSVLSVGPAFADAGAPGTTFPEQPGTHVATACAAVGANTGTGGAHMSGTAGGITSGLFADACPPPS